MNAIWRPSGDQDGSLSSIFLPRVTWRTLVPSAFITCTWPLRTKASRFPAGDQAGSASPGTRVKSRAPRPSGLITAIPAPFRPRPGPAANAIKPLRPGGVDEPTPTTTDATHPSAASAASDRPTRCTIDESSATAGTPSRPATRDETPAHELKELVAVAQRTGERVAPLGSRRPQWRSSLHRSDDARAFDRLSLADCWRHDPGCAHVDQAIPDSLGCRDRRAGHC